MNRKPSICFYTGYVDVFNVSKECYNEPLYGSETALIHLGKLFQRYFTVYVCSWDDHGFPEVVIDGFHVVSSNVFRTKQIIFDVLIISRYIQWFIEFSHLCAKSIYVWIHDLQPLQWFNGGVIPNDGCGLIDNTMNVVDKYVALTRWHCGNLYTISDRSKIAIIGNGVSESTVKYALMSRKNTKIKNRFIWTSSYDRGLEQYIEFFCKVRQLLPDAELHIFRDSKVLPHNPEFIKFRGYKNNEEVFAEMLKAEFWVYPTGFHETYCISALEAQLAGCLIIGTKRGALQNTVDDRGILIEDSDVYSDKYWDDVFESIRYLSMIPEWERTRIREKAFSWAVNQTWNQRAREWTSMFLTKSPNLLSVDCDVNELYKDDLPRLQ